MPTYSVPNLTPEAKRLWDALSAEERRQLVEVAWCGYCIGPGPMRPIAGLVKQGRLVIEGPCLRCQNAMVRIADSPPPRRGSARR
jgi:hypothetical protein